MPTLSPWAQKSLCRKTGRGEVAGRVGSKVGLTGTCVALIVRSIWSPGRTTALQYRKLQPTDTRHQVVSWHPTDRSISGTTANAVRVWLRMLDGSASSPPGSARGPARSGLLDAGLNGSKEV